MKTVRNLVLSVSVLALGACSAIDSFNEVEALNEAQSVGSPFTQALANEYREFSNIQLDDHFDYPDALHFARKGLAAASGEVVLPEPVVDWNVDSFHAQELETARGRLIIAFDYGARETSPALAAKVQSRFDCWIEFQEERWRDGNVPCKNEFFTHLAELESGLTPPRVTEEAPMEEPIIVETPPAPAFDSEVFDIDPEEPMAPENAMYLVFFNWDSSEIGSGALSVIDAVAEEVVASAPETVNIVGHSDTSGPKDYNQRLALRRAKATKTKLTERGVSADIVKLDAMGEEDLLVPTPDDVREPANRRVNITFE